MRTYTKLNTPKIRKILWGFDLQEVEANMKEFKSALNDFFFEIEREKGKQFQEEELPRIVISYAFGWDDARLRT